MSKLFRILTIPVVFPYFLLIALIEAFNRKPKQNPDDDILVCLNARNREIWHTLTPEQRQRFRETMEKGTVYLPF